MTNQTQAKKQRLKEIVYYINSFLGLLVIAFVPLWMYAIAPKFTRVSDDFAYSANIVSVDNFYDETKQSYLGDTKSYTNYSYNIVNNYSDKNIVEIKNAFEVKNIFGEKIFSVERLYGIDTKSGKHVAGYGDKDRNGYLFAPHNLKAGESFTYWHVNYDAPALMQYVDSEVMDGIEVYRYESRYEGTTVDQTENLGNLPDVPEIRGVRLKPYLQLWVEPVSGHIVNYKDDTIAYYYDIKTGREIAPWNHFSNTFTASSVQKHLVIADSERQQIFFYSTVVPTFIGFVGVVIFITTLLTARQAKYGQNKATILITPLSVLVVTISATYFSWWFVAQNIKQIEDAAFETQTKEINYQIEDQFEYYLNILRGARGLFYSSDQITRSEFKTYVQTQEIQKTKPGIQGVGYSQVVLPEEKEAFEKSIRDEGFPDFKIVPEGERDIYTSVVYLEPFDERNQRAFGYDMYQEPIRQKAMKSAAASGEATMSGKIILQQETDADVQSGFLIYLPVYKSESYDEIKGYVYSPFRVYDFMRGIERASEAIEIRIYDNTVANQNLMYKSSMTTKSDKLLSQEKLVTVGDHSWVVQYSADRGFDSDFTQRILPFLVAFLGIALSLLLSGGVYVLKLYNLKAAERALSINKALDEATANIQAMLLGIGEGLIVTDKYGVVTVVNNAFTKVTGFTKQEVVGNLFDAKLKLLDKDGKEVIQYNRLLNVALRDLKVIRSTALQYYVRKDGTKFPVSITASPVLIDGKLIGAVEVFRDITKEQDIDKTKTEFVSLASHQLLTPLTSINWYIDLLRSGDAGKLTKEQKAYLDEVNIGSQRMVDLVNSLLNVSRIELGTFMIQPIPTDIIKLFEDVYNEQQTVLKAKKLEFVRNFTDNLLIINVDPKPLFIIFQNLLSNAIKYTPEKGKISVTIDTKKADSEFGGRLLKTDSLVISVTDTGYGIPKGQQDKLFTKLFRADNVKSKNTQGTGLGLYIVKSIIESSGSQIWFESKENKGTAFYIAIPASGMLKREGSKELNNN